MKFRKNIWILVLCLAVCLGESFSCAETVPGDLNARFSSESDIVRDGVTYRLRKRLTTILLAGTDKREGDIIAPDEYRNGGQADFLLLLVIDANRDTVQPIQINRDTMAEITILNVLGKDVGTRRAQICLAHGFGDGAAQSCELLTRAVSGLFRNVPIDRYAVMNLDGIAALNDAMGGVEVTLKDDFTAYDSEMTAGKTLTLRGMQAEYFVRQRYYVGEQTNTARMERQKIYMQAALDRIEDGVRADSDYVRALIGAVEPYLQTDMSNGRIANLASQVAEYEVLPMITPEGETVLSEREFIEFHADEDALEQLILDAFYEPVG